MAKQNIKDPGAHHNSSGALIRRFLPYLAKHKAVLFLDLFCAALTTLCDIFLPKIMSTITNSAMGVGITLTTGIVLKLAGIYFVLRIIDGAAQYFMSGIGHIMGVHIETDMRRDAFDHLLQLDHTYYNNTKVGTIMGRITNDLFDVTEFAHHCPEEFFIAGIKIVASFVILCRASIPLTLAVFACVPLMGVVSVYLNGSLRARFRQQRVQIGELNSTIEDSLLGQGVVKAFAAEDEEREKFAKGNRAFEQIKTLGYYAMGAFNTSTRLFDGLMYLVVILAGGLSLVYGKITAGDLVAYMLYVTTLIATIRRIVEFAEQFQRGMTGIERFAEIMDTPVPIHDAPDARPLQPGPGAIRFENVSFEYGGNADKETYSAMDQIENGVAVGMPMDELLGDGVTEKDLSLTLAPSAEERAKLDPFYMSYFVPWNSYKNYQIAKAHGFDDLTHEWDRTHHAENFDQIDSRAYLVHSWLKYPKFGHAAATDYTARYIRYGMMTREEAIPIIKARDGKLDPLCVRDFCDFCGYTETEFWAIMDKFYNRDLFEKNEYDEWQLKHPIWEENK